MVRSNRNCFFQNNFDLSILSDINKYIHCIIAQQNNDKFGKYEQKSRGITYSHACYQVMR